MLGKVSQSLSRLHKVGLGTLSHLHHPSFASFRPANNDETERRKNLQGRILARKKEGETNKFKTLFTDRQSHPVGR